MHCGNVAAAGSERTADEVDRDVIPASLMRQHAHQVQHVGIVRFVRQKLAVQLVRLLQPPGTVMLDGQAKRLLECHSPHVEIQVNGGTGY
jgi:hypothetical protein